MEVSLSPPCVSSWSPVGAEPAAQCGSLRYLLRNASSSSSYAAEELDEGDNNRGLRFIDEVVGGSGWKAVEERFHKVARIEPGPIPVIAAGDFGYCFGIQKTPEFANELLRALRGKQVRSTEITKAELQHLVRSTEITKAELQHLWCRLSSPCFHSRAQILFDLCDSNVDGKLTPDEIKQAIMLSFSTNKLSITQKEAEEYSSLIMEEYDTGKLGYIEAGVEPAFGKVDLTR